MRDVREVTIHNRRIAIATILVLVLCVAFFVRTRPSEFVYPPDEQVHSLAEEIRWEARIKEVGGKAAYEEFARAVQDVPPGKQHKLAHAFGGALYDVEGEQGAGVCDERYLYGCWHEYLGRFVAAEGLAGISKLRAICESTTMKNSCAHAIGHGLVAYLGYTLPELMQALEDCSAQEAGAYVQQCINGAFMEYDLRFLSDADPGAVRLLPANKDWYGPCDVLPSTYASRCVQNLPEEWRVLLSVATSSADQPFKKIGDLCSALPETLAFARMNCYVGIGLAVSNVSADIHEYERSCAYAAKSEEDRLVCLSVAGANLGSIRSDRSAGIIACETFSGNTKNLCAEYVQGSPWDFTRPLPQV